MRAKLFLTILLGLISSPVFGLDLRFRPVIDQNVTEDVYIASSTCAGGFSINVSTFPGYANHVTISSGGAAGSWLRVYDAMSGTDTVRLIGGPYPADAVNTFWLKTAVSSGTTYSVDTSGGRMPCLNFYNRNK